MMGQSKVKSVILAHSCPALSTSEAECYAASGQDVSISAVATAWSWAQRRGSTAERTRWPSPIALVLGQTGERRLPKFSKTDLARAY